MSPAPRPVLRAALAVACTIACEAATLAAQNPAPTPAPVSEAWQFVQPPQSSLVFARDGSLIGEIGREWRTSVSIKTLPAYVGQAFISVEDQRFYKHHGVDYVGIAGAIKDDLMGAYRGASTITQQLVGNMHPDLIDRRDPSPARKIREQKAALEMEKHYSKEQILEGYLNQINFGHGWYGIDEAARHYFGKPAAQLTLVEAATLAALPKSPVNYDPAHHPDRAKQRRDAILNLMVAQKFIRQSDADAAKREPVKTVPDGGMSAPSQHYVDVVRVQAERAGIAVSNGGFRIYTGLDPALQRSATDALTEEALAIEQRPGYAHQTFANRRKGSHDYLQGAVVAIDPYTGDVRALVGGRNYQDSPFNRAVAGLRQPGSSFKPFVYARAILDSIPPNAIVPDTALEVTYDRQVYRPKNSDGEFLGDLTLREALARSRNPVAVQLWLRLGADSIVALARRFGLSAPIAPYPSSAIGASVVQPLDFVAAYTALATLGTSAQPRFIHRIEDRAGAVVYNEPVSALPPAVDPSVAFIVRDMMRDVVDRGTATAVRKYIPFDVPVAGKTGTTDDNTDVWFVGATPEIVAGVWLGFDKPQTIAERGVAGGLLAAPVFARMLGTAGYTHASDAWNTPPPGVVSAVLDRKTGKLAGADTPPDRRYVEYFIPGTEPGALRIDPRRLFLLGPIVF